MTSTAELTLEAQPCVMCKGPTCDDVGSVSMHQQCSMQAQDPLRFRNPYPRRDVDGYVVDEALTVEDLAPNAPWNAGAEGF